MNLYRGLSVVIGLMILSTASAALKTASDFSWQLNITPGYDSNVFKAPSSDYKDFATSAGTLITPDVQAGFFSDLDLELNYRAKPKRRSSFVSDYRIKSTLYADSQLENANKTKQRVFLGYDVKFKDKKAKRDKLIGGVFLRVVNDLYVDRDSGNVQTVTINATLPNEEIIDISDRYSYQSVGFNGKYAKNLSRKWKLTFDAKLEQLDYDDPAPGVSSQYDHDVTSLGASAAYDVSKPMKVKVGYQITTKDYSTRSSRNLKGQLFKSNPTLKYQFATLEASMRYRINKKFVSYVDFQHKERSDDFVGYNDYVSNKIKVRALFDVSKKIDIKASASSYQRDYDNAFAFDQDVHADVDFVQESKEFSGTVFVLKGSFQHTPNRAYWSKIDLKDEQSSDKRYEYERTQFTAGVSWEY